MPTPREAHTPEARSVLNILRALAISRAKPSTVKQLLKEYTDLEGHSVNYRKFGYENLEDFIVESDEFVIHNMKGEMYLTPRPNSQTEHIRHMIRYQKAPKIRTSSKLREPKKSDKSWNKSSYSSNVYNKLSVSRKLSSKRSSQKSRRIRRRNEGNGNDRSSNSGGGGGGFNRGADSNNNQSNNRNNNNMSLSKEQSNKNNQSSLNKSAVKSPQSSLQDRLKQNRKEQQLKNDVEMRTVELAKDLNKLQLEQQKQQQQLELQKRQLEQQRQQLEQQKQQQQLEQQKLQLEQQRQQLELEKQKQQKQRLEQKKQQLELKKQQQQQQLQSQKKQNVPSNTQINEDKRQLEQSQQITIASQRRLITITNNVNNSEQHQRQLKQMWPQPDQQQQQQQQFQNQQQQFQNQQQQFQYQQQQFQYQYQLQNQQQLLQNQQQQHQLQRRFSDESFVNTPIVCKGSLQDRLKIAQRQQQQQQKQEITRRNSSNDDTRTQQNMYSPSNISSNDSLYLESNNLSDTVIMNESRRIIRTIDNTRQQQEEQEDEHQQHQQFQRYDFDSYSNFMDASEQLEQYCLARKYEKPVYKFIRSRFSPKIHGRVIVNGATYSTYPDEFDTELLAKISSASKAIDEIRIQESRNCYPICTDSDTEIAIKLYEEIKEHKCGIFHKKIPEIFCLRYQKLLPDNWFSIIQESNMFAIEMILNGNMIIFAKEETIESGSPSLTSECDETDGFVMERLSLPWENKYWNVYITYCTSTIEIWGRIVDPGYNDKLDALLNDIDVYMLTDKKRPISIVCGQIYLLSISECWNRVRVEEMNKETGKCLCFFIDYGDEEWYTMDELCICETKFLLLPPQAICLSLFGLEDFAENPNAKKHLDELSGKSFVAEILTKKEQYEIDENQMMVTDDINNSNMKIQCCLYDTSTNEDVNLNPNLLNKICDDTQPPTLKRTGVNNVHITHIYKNGELYLQIKNLELQYVQKLVQQLVESKFKRDQHKVNEFDMKMGKLYFVQDPNDERWYRGTLTTENYNDDNKQQQQQQQSHQHMIGGSKNSDGTYKIFYVDYGLTKNIPLSRIYRLDSLSAALSKFPRQAIKVKLHKLPPINDKIIGLMRGLLPAGTPAIAKVAVNAVIPQVIIYKRFEDKGGLFNVNESIHIEYELECSNEIVDTQATTITPTITSPIPKKIERHDSPILDNNISNNIGFGSNSSATNVRTLSSLRTQMTVPNSPQKEFSKLLDNVLVPDVGQQFHIIVTMASNPSNFMVRPYNDGRKLFELMEELKVYCTSNDEFIPIDMIEVGQAYAAFSSTDGYYYRVTVENILSSMAIHVYFCDLGSVAVLSNDKLKTLPDKFRTLPKQAIAAKLSDIKPIHGDWTLQDCIRFQELTVKQKFISIIRKISDDPVTPGTKVLELQLIDVQTDEDIYIHEVMIKEGRAINC